MIDSLVNKPLVSLSLLAVTMLPQDLQAKCPCSEKTNQSFSGSRDSYSEDARTPMDDLFSPVTANEHYSPVPVPASVRQQAPHRQPLQVSAVRPPGTLGKTYYRASREVPADKHPRIAMIDVIAKNATQVDVYNITPHRETDAVEGFENQLTEGLWQFETNPLIPGLPNIYKVVFRFSDEPNAPETVRYIRLIPGRVVQITY